MHKLKSKAIILYQQEYLHIRDTWCKSIYVSLLLKAIQMAQVVSVTTTSIELQSDDQLIQLGVQPALNYFKYVYHLIRIYTIFNNSVDGQLAFMIAILGLDIILVLLLFYFTLQVEIDEVKMQNQMKLITESKAQHVVIQTGNKYIKLAISIYIQLYQQLIIIPLYYCDFLIINEVMDGITIIKVGTNLISNYFIVLAIIQLITSSLLNLLIDQHSFEYRFKKHNQLGKHTSKLLLVTQISELLLTLLSGFQLQVALYLGTLYTFGNLLVHISKSIYVDHAVCRMISNYTLIVLLYYISLVLSQLTADHIQLQTTLLILFSSPLGLIILNRVQERMDTNSWDSNVVHSSRAIYSVFCNMKLAERNHQQPNALYTVRLYTYIANHIRFCRIRRDKMQQQEINIKHTCFCDEYFAAHPNKQFNSIKDMKEFTCGIIKQQLEDQSLINPEDQRIIYTYIYFLIQVNKLPSQALYQILRLDHKQRDVLLYCYSKQSTMQSKAIMRHIQNSALLEFQGIVSKHDLRNQKYNFRALYEFEENILTIKHNLERSVQLLLEWYSMILTPEIATQQVHVKGLIIIECMAILQKQLQTVFLINPLSTEVDTLYNIFQTYVNFNSRRPKEFKRDGPAVQKFLQSIEKQIFDKSSCLIQITLMQPRGHVIGFTKTFQRAIGYSAEEIKDQNIKKFMPSIIAADHDIYLNNFVERGRISIVKREVRVILGKNKNQFIIPINTRIRVEANLHDFGATALITPANMSIGYLLLSDDGKIQEISQNIFDDLFGCHLNIPLNLVRGLDCLMFIPDLSKIWEDIMAGDVEHLDMRLVCQLVLPQMKSMTSSRSKYNITTARAFQWALVNYLDTQNDYVRYSATLKLSSLVTINQQLVIIEVHDYKIDHTKRYEADQLIQIKMRQQKLQHFVTSTTTYSKSTFVQPKSVVVSDWEDDGYNIKEDMLKEDSLMIEQQKQQFSAVNFTIANQMPSQIPLRSDFDREPQFYLEEEEIEQQHEPQMNQSSRRQRSKARKQLKQHSGQQVQIQVATSIGGKSAGTPEGIKQMINSSLHDNSSLDTKFNIVMIVFSSLLIILNSINFSIQYSDIQQVIQYQQLLVVPYMQGYFYHELIISFFHKDEVADFPYSKLIEQSQQYQTDSTSDIDIITKDLNSINVVLEQYNITYIEYILDVMNQMILISEQNEMLDLDMYLSTSQKFIDILSTLSNTTNITNSTIYMQQFNLNSIITVEVLIISFMLYYVGQLLYFVKKQRRILRLFTKLESKPMFDLYLKLILVAKQMASPSFRKMETNEDHFDQSMSRHYYKQISSEVQVQVRTVGKSVTREKVSKQIYLSLIIIMGSTLLYSSSTIINYGTTNRSITNNQSFNAEKQMFLQTCVTLAQSFSQIEIITSQSKIVYSQEVKGFIDKGINQLNKLSNQLSLYQESQNTLTYTILTQSACLSFDAQQLIGPYFTLFTKVQCQQLQLLNGGTSLVIQTLYRYLLNFQQSFENNQIEIDSKQYQVERLYISMGLFGIVDSITDYQNYLQQQVIVLNIIIISMYIGVVVIIFAVLRHLLYKQKQREQQCKLLFSLIPINQLTENAYFISFIRQDLGKSSNC